jgi:hypothetical protein
MTKLKLLEVIEAAYAVIRETHRQNFTKKAMM